MTVVDTAVLAAQVVVTVLGCAVAVLHLVAPKTKTETDDKVATKLEKVRDFVTAVLAKVVVPKALK